MPNRSPAEVTAGLRNRALTTFPAKIRSNPAYRDAATLGVLMETGYEKAVASLVAFITGDASIYFSSGGGIIGGQGHAEVRIAAQRLTQFAGVHVSEMSPCTDYPLPGVGQTAFYVITPGGIFTLTAAEKQLGSGSHDFSPLFHVGHYLIARLRMATEKK